MCLIDKKQFRCTESKIPIWKVVRMRDGKLKSPYQGSILHRLNQEVVLNTEHQLCNFPDIISYYQFNEKRYVFDEGFYHAFLNKEAAESFIQNLLMPRSFANPYPNNPYKLVIIEGYIPENTRYALDIDGVSVCARRMILNI